MTEESHIKISKQQNEIHNGNVTLLWTLSSLIVVFRFFLLGSSPFIVCFNLFLMGVGVAGTGDATAAWYCCK